MSWEEFKEAVSRFEHLYHGNLDSFMEFGPEQLQYRNWQGKLMIFPQSLAEKQARWDAIQEIQHCTGTAELDCFGLHSTAEYTDSQLVQVRGSGALAWIDAKNYFARMQVKRCELSIDEISVIEEMDCSLGSTNLDELGYTLFSAQVGHSTGQLTAMAKIINSDRLVDEITKLEYTFLHKYHLYDKSFFYSLDTHISDPMYQGSATFNGQGKLCNIDFIYKAGKAESLDWLVMGK